MGELRSHQTFSSANSRGIKIPVSRPVSDLTDTVFFPLAGLLAIVMVSLAMRQPSNPLPTGSISGADTDYRIVRVSGLDLNRFVAGEYSDYAIVPTDSGPALRISPATDFFPDNPDKGPHFRLAPDLETVFSGRDLRINVRARATETNGAAHFEVNYFAGPEGQSGWQKFALQPDFKNYSFEFTAPLANQDLGVDFLGIRPVIDSEGAGLEVESLTFINLHLWRNRPPAAGGER